MAYYSSRKKEGNFAFCNIIDGSWGHYAKYVEQRNTNTISSLLYVESKLKTKAKSKLMHKKNRLVIVSGGGCGMGEMGKLFLFLA